MNSEREINRRSIELLQHSLEPAKPDVSIVVNDTHKRLAELLAATPGMYLNERERHICWLLFNGYSRNEIADHLGISVPALSNTLCRAAKRERCSDVLSLVCGYVKEYCDNMTNEWKAIGEGPLPERGPAKS